MCVSCGLKLMIARPQQRHSDVIPYERQCPTREETKTTVGAGRIALGRIEDFASDQHFCCDTLPLGLLPFRLVLPELSAVLMRPGRD